MTSTIDVAIRAACSRHPLQHLHLHFANADASGMNHSTNPRASAADNIATANFVVHGSGRGGRAVPFSMRRGMLTRPLRTSS
ncbi:unnamed protein product [Closterium sp. NIES-53]